MCGIFGGFSLFGEKLDVNSIIRATNSLIHRGPDDFGLKKLENVIIGHRRLSIIDLDTDAAKQPVAYKNSLLAYNGMIYNFKDLKKILSTNNIFKGNSDTEVLAKCLTQWGIRKTLSKIDGMFAFVWFDKKKNEIYLVRDPMGEKPLYWTKMKNKIYFSSEIKSFFRINEFTKKPNINDIDDYFYTSKISGSKTIYSEINEVEPGNIVRFSTLNGNISISNYFSLENSFLNKISPKNEIEKLNEYMEKSVFTRTISDVPFGSLLSGGIDSSLILSYMMKNDNINKVTCYSADVRNKKLSELKDAQNVISFLKKIHK